MAVQAVVRALLLLIAAATVHAADAPLTLERLLADIARAPAGEVAFRETRHSSALKAPLESSGVMRFRRPDFLEKHVTAPFNDRFAVEGDTVTIERGKGKPITLSLASQPVLRAFIEGIRGTLRGDLGTLKRYYRVELENAAAGWTIVLLPAEVEMGELVRMIRISGREARLQSVEVQEASGDRSVMRVVDNPKK